MRLGRHAIYLRLPHGCRRTALHNHFFERAVGVVATTRNLRTVRALAGLTAAG